MKGNKILIKLGDFIVNFRYLFLTLFIGLMIICGINLNNVEVNDDITSYLPDKTETKDGIDLMNREFGSLNEMQFLVMDLSYDDALIKMEKLEALEHVKKVSFDDTENYYKNDNALFILQLDDVNDEQRDNIADEVRKIAENNEYYLYIENEGNVVNGMTLILGLVVTVIVVVLLFTSKSYFDIILAFVIFGISILLNMGSNFILGEISYITKSIAVVLQLGLSLDYLIIFLNHYMKEIKDTNDKYLAVKKTVSKSIPEIFASSLTTIAGLMALVFMQLKIGGDIGIVMSKGILCSMLTVILLLPCLLLIFNKIILKFEHKSFVPDVTKLSKKIVRGKKVLLPLFIVFVIISIFLVSKYEYVYNIYSVKSITKSDTQIAIDKIEESFSKNNRLVVLVKNEEKDYAKELSTVESLLENDKIISVTSIANVPVSDNLYLGSEINSKEFAGIFGVDERVSTSLYQLYAKENNELEKLANMDTYKVTIVDWIYFLNEHQSELSLNKEMKTKIETYYSAIEESYSLVESKDYSRFILEFKGNVEGDETFDLLDYVKDKVSEEYSDVKLVGESVSAKDLKDTFSKDNTIINVITIIFIAIILLCTFKSFGMTLLLILTIEGSIFINFGLVTLLGKKIFFISYIIVSAIQMGATIDYAIVMSNRYLTLRKKKSREDALIGTLKDSLPAIVTSGLILTIAGFLIGFISDSGVVASIGLFLGCGTLISMICTILILPAILYVCDTFIKKTTFKKNKD